MQKTYLGDSVYAEFDGFQIILTTNNGYPDDPRNTIALEPSVFEALLQYKAKISNNTKPSSQLDPDVKDAIFEQAPPAIKCPSCSQDISQQDWDDGSKCPLCGAELF